MNTMIGVRYAVAVAVLAAFSFLIFTVLATNPAGASSGGVGTVSPTSGSTESGSGDANTSGRELAKYDRLWERVDIRDRRWARKTAECESGGDPHALGSGGRYRGAFQFMRSTWRTAPRSPGGDPIAYPYRTQAVVAIALKQRDGVHHWPVCG